MAAMRSVLLKHLRVKAGYPLRSPMTFSFSQLLCHHFSEEVKGSFLDKSEVTDRVITVVKNFQMVDPSKVTPKANYPR
ncbi:Acyl carrier protein 2, mitochondrial [Dendrobium catenatum]|uniref:Acyl carrier protein 2, mitochondrial n=1 Tax=Dendrobium catenatum TaxID=906689 RepID=A0A2I0WBN2_9ASPA|nr:Acyl carrier protein 2, mitochondrial [Dendrobium catenatum]